MMVKQGLKPTASAGRRLPRHRRRAAPEPCRSILKTAPGRATWSAFVLRHERARLRLGRATAPSSSPTAAWRWRPDANRLAQIAINAEAAWRSLFADAEPVIAMLSHSSYGSAKNDDSDKVVRADGQGRGARARTRGRRRAAAGRRHRCRSSAAKAPASPVAGRANVLVFPDIDAGDARLQAGAALGEGRTAPSCRVSPPR